MSAVPERVPQLRDDVIVTLLFPAITEEWADDALRDCWVTTDVERDEDGDLIVTAKVGGNTNGVSVLRMVCDEIEEALRECEVDPMEFTATVRAVEPPATVVVQDEPATTGGERT